VLLVSFSNLAVPSCLAQVTSKTAVLESTTPYKKVALVIGNARYISRGMAFADDVAKAVENDAIDMQTALSRQGFQVSLKTNLSRAQMVDAMNEFKANVSESRGVALFFYSGHGVEYEGNNYILPVDTFLSSKYDIPTQTINVNSLISDLRSDSASNARVNIILLDACRDTPAEARSKGVNRSGFRSISPPNGTAIGFATAPGTRTADLELNRRNSAYTGALLKYISRTNTSLDELFTFVRNEVLTQTSNKQEPWSTFSTNAKYVFNPVWQLQGTWKADSGAIYKIRRKGREVKILWGVPPSSITPGAYKEDDLSFEGKIVDGDITGKRYYKWKPDAVSSCPNLDGWWKTSAVGKISENGNVITWTSRKVKTEPNTCNAIVGDEYISTWRRWN
jgi:hypothetical protein